MKTCFVVGGDSSLGVEIRSTFDAGGYEVFFTSRRSNHETSGQIFFFDGSDSRHLREQLRGLSIDCLAICVGKLGGRSLVNYNDELIDQVVDSNLSAVIKSVHALEPLLADKASVLFVGSIAGVAGSYDEVYAASKAGLVGLTKSLARKSKRGIRFNCVCPGLIEGTTMFSEFSAAEIERHLLATPVNRFPTAKEIARICMDISSPAWGSMNGEILNINGGRYV